MLIVLSVPVFASAVKVTIQLSAGATPGTGFSLRFEAPDGTGFERRTTSMHSAEWHLPAGNYRLTLIEPGFWSAPREISVSAQGASVELPVYRASVIAGRVSGGGSVPDHLIARFEDAGGSTLRGEVRCPIVQRSFRCFVPAARLNLALKAPGFVTRYRSAVDASVESASVGFIDLVPGAVLTGFVTAQRGVSLDKALVRATPIRSAPSFGDDGVATDLTSLTTQADGHGFFHFDAIPPGDYTLEALGGTRRSVRISARVLESAEAELRDPLVLEEPHDVEILVRPSRDPYNRRWTVRLERRTDVAMRVATERRESIGPDGRGTLHAVPAGAYTLILGTEGNETWAQREVIVPQVSTVEIALPRTFIRGVVTIGGMPLSASLEFHHAAGATVAARSRADGRFALFFPEDEVEWIGRVRIRSDAPRVDRSLSHVRVDRDDRGDASIRIDLPSTYLAGVVVDGRGIAVRRAIVRVESSNAGVLEVPTNQDGSFEIHAPPSGPARLRAYAEGAMSTAVQVELVENGRTEDVRLAVQPSLRLTGRVLSPTGALPGASVYAFPQSRAAVASPIATTGVDGRYDVALPPETTEVDVFVSAPSFATQVFRHRLSETTNLDLRMTQLTGTLVVETGTRNIMIHHRGAAVGLNLFAYHGGIRESTALRVPNLEPGSYVICGAAPPCETATVVPHGEVRVRLE